MRHSESGLRLLQTTNTGYNLRTMATHQEKGNALEAAVLAVEELILRASPTVKEKAYRIESKKLINVGGVHHEIDLFVTFELGPGYNPVYIFECKNWKEAVGKNEIIIFAEKIAAAGAQRGFFVAKSFTADAVAQAEKEPRMELVVAAEHDPASTILPFAYQSTFTKPLHIEGVFRKWGGTGKEFVKVDLSQAVASLNGSSLNLMEYINSWVAESMNESMRTFPSGTLADITKLLLANKAYVNLTTDAGNTPLEWAALNGHTDVAALLIANRADVNAKDDKGWTPLGCAVYQGSERHD